MPSVSKATSKTHIATQHSSSPEIQELGLGRGKRVRNPPKRADASSSDSESDEVEEQPKKKSKPNKKTSSKKKNKKKKKAPVRSDTESLESSDPSDNESALVRPLTYFIMHPSIFVKRQELKH